MTFANIPAGISVFLDANVFLFHFAAQDLLERILRGELTGFTSTHMLTEMGHRLMTIEAMKVQPWPVAGIAQRLRKNPDVVKGLTRFRQAIQEVPAFGIHVLPIHKDLLDAGAAVSQNTGLLTNDALIVAVMQASGLTHLASSDPDFDGVPGLVRYAPS
jgi:predicted nucleic acid-binding protein